MAFLIGENDWTFGMSSLRRGRSGGLGQTAAQRVGEIAFQLLNNDGYPIRIPRAVWYRITETEGKNVINSVKKTVTTDDRGIFKIEYIHSKQAAPFTVELGLDNLLTAGANIDVPDREAIFDAVPTTKIVPLYWLKENFGLPAAGVLNPPERMINGPGIVPAPDPKPYVMSPNAPKADSGYPVTFGVYSFPGKIPLPGVQLTSYDHYTGKDRDTALTNENGIATLYLEPAGQFSFFSGPGVSTVKVTGFPEGYRNPAPESMRIEIHQHTRVWNPDNSGSRKRVSDNQIVPDYAFVLERAGAPQAPPPAPPPPPPAMDKPAPVSVADPSAGRVVIPSSPKEAQAQADAKTKDIQQEGGVPWGLILVAGGVAAAAWYFLWPQLTGEPRPAFAGLGRSRRPRRRRR